MAEDNKRKRTLVKVGEKSNERYDSYGHKIEKRSVSTTPVTPPKKELPKREPEKEREATGETTTKQEPQRKKEKRTPAKKLYSGATQEELPSHERRIQERAPQRRKNILKILKIAMVLLLIAGTVCLFIFGIGEKKSDIEQAFLTTGTIENLYNVKAHIIRDEYGITAGFSGKMLSAVNDGDRVAAGATIGYIVKPEYEQELVKLRQVDDKIAAVQNAASYVESQHTELGFMNEQINGLTDRLAGMSADSSNLSQYYSVMKELDSLFGTKHEIIINADVSDDYLRELQAERKRIESGLSSFMVEVKTSQAGVVSFYADSQTQDATDKTAQISEYLRKKGETGNYLSEEALRYTQSNLYYSVGTDVTQGQTVARVTPDVTYYIAAEVSGLDYSVFQAGKQITVRSKNRDFSVEAAVEEVLKFGDKAYVLFESSTGVAGAAAERIIDSELIIDQMSGLKVPKRALSEWDSAGLTARIAVLRSSYVSYVYVNILAEDGEYAIISPSNDFVTEQDEGVTSVRVNDIYVVNHEKVTEGQIIGG